MPQGQRRVVRAGNDDVPAATPAASAYNHVADGDVAKDRQRRARPFDDVRAAHVHCRHGACEDLAHAVDKERGQTHGSSVGTTVTALPVGGARRRRPPRRGSLPADWPRLVPLEFMEWRCRRADAHMEARVLLNQVLAVGGFKAHEPAHL